MLQCSVQTLANYERRGKLHPKSAYRPDKRGIEHRVTVYDPHELTKLATRLNRHVDVSSRDPGEIAARAYEIFDAGRPQKDVVQELRVTPDTVRELYEKWLDSGGADLVITPLSKELLEKLVGPFDSVTTLIEQLQRQLRVEGDAPPSAG